MLYQRLAPGPPAEHAQPFLATGPSPAAGSSGEAPPPTTPLSSAFGRWDAAPDLERWLTSFYQYYQLKGYMGVLAVTLLHLAAVAFTVAFSFWLFFFIDWEAVLSCHSEEACRAVSITFERPFEDVGFRRGAVFFCFVLFFIYWLCNLANAINTICDAGEMSHYYKERLGISSDDALGAMLWSEVVSRLVQQQRATPFCVVQDELTVLEIANIIMREDNFVIALTNHEAFTSRLPRWIPPRLAYTRAVLTCVRHAVFRFALDSRGRICQDFINRPLTLAKRLRLMGLLTLLLVIPVSVFVTLVFFMRHAEEFRSHRASPFRREWTDYAKWTFREYNELPHQFKERMRMAQTVAEEFASSTRPASPVLDSLQRFVRFVAGSVLAVLLILALVDDSPLLFVKIQEKNLLWYLAFFGFLFAVADHSGEDGPPSGGSGGGGGSGRFLPTSGAPGAAGTTGGGGAGAATGTPLLLHMAMMRLVRCTHFLPISWRAPAPLAALAGGCGGVQRAGLRRHFEAIRSELLRDLFVTRIQALAEELLGVLLAPLLLIVYLPESAPDIVDVMRRSRHSSANLGDWCVFGCLDPSLSGSEFYSGPAWRLGGDGGGGSSSSGSALSSSNGGVSWGSDGAVEHRGAAGCGQAFVEPRLFSNGGKLEKSVLSFILSHRLPWSSSPRLDCFAGGGAAGMDDADFSLSHDLAWRSGDVSFGRPAQNGSRTFRRAVGESPPGAAADQPAFPLRDFGANGKDEAAIVASAATFSMSASQEAGAALSSKAQALSAQADSSSVGVEVWGYPVCALTFLHDLEEFQQRETRASSPQHRLYKLFPEELLRLDRAAPVPGAAPVPPAALPLFGGGGGAGLLEGQVGQSSCSSHFFWLEVLYDFYSGRHASHLGDAGGGVTFELSDDCEGRPSNAFVPVAASAGVLGGGLGGGGGAGGGGGGDQEALFSGLAEP